MQVLIMFRLSEGLWLKACDGCSSCRMHFLPIQFAILACSFRYWNIRGFCVMSTAMERLQIYTLCPFSLKSKNQCHLQRNMEITPPNCPALSIGKLRYAILIHTPLIEEQHTLESKKKVCDGEKEKHCSFQLNK